MRRSTLTFAGGAGTVTGSKHWIRTTHGQLLLDCGLFQGVKALRLRNWAEPPFDPREIDAVVLSHGHIDHCGYLPLLVRRGFRGPIYCTPGTADLLAISLPDSARLQEEDAARANRVGYTKHHPALPLYSVDDVEVTLRLLAPRSYGARFGVMHEAHALFRRAGHILGSATIDLELGAGENKRLVFSGDLGRWGRPILRDPELVPRAHTLLVESTYGNRVHAHDAEETLVRVITDTAHRGGVVVVPAFAIGRTQELLWTIRKLEREGRLPLISVHLDSPMASSVNSAYGKHPEDLDADLRAMIARGDSPIASGNYNAVQDASESKALNAVQGPMIVIAGSGMATGGRVLHHLKFRLPDHRNTVLLTGFQAAGTRGRSLVEGAASVRIHGEDIPVRAHVEVVNGLSAHADQSELLRWLGGFEKPPAHTYVVHGESEASNALAAAIRTRLGWSVSIAVDGETVVL